MGKRMAVAATAALLGLGVASTPVQAGTSSNGTSGSTSCTIIGTIGDDEIVGTPGPDVICARSGNDVIHGLGGDDLIYGGPGDDHIDAGDGDDRVFGLEGDDVVNGGPGRDRIGGGSGNDYLSGNEGNDTIWGASGDDVILGGAGSDLAFGDDGSDVVYSSGPDESETTPNRIGGGPGHDELIGSDGRDVIFPGPDGADINAGEGSNLITGHALDVGDLRVVGGSGADWVIFGEFGVGPDPRTFGHIELDLGDGNNRVRLNASASAPDLATSSVSIKTGDGNDRHEIEIAGTIGGDFVIDSTDGRDLVALQGNATVEGDQRLSLGDGGNEFILEQFTVEGDRFVVGGAGADTVGVSAFQIGFTRDRFVIDLMGGNDRVDLDGSRSGLLQVDLGSGDDIVVDVFETTFDFGSFIDGGLGNDEVRFGADSFVPRSEDNTAALPGVEIVSGPSWERACDPFFGPLIVDPRCP